MVNCFAFAYVSPLQSRLAKVENEMKDKIKTTAEERDAADRRLNNTAEALRLQKDLRMKEMLQQQVSRKRCFVVLGLWHCSVDTTPVAGSTALRDVLFMSSANA